MNPELLTDPVFRELRQLVAELSLISHVGGTSYDGKMARATDEEVGGRRPSGGDVDRPRRPQEGADPKAWSEFYDELASWEVSYQRRTPAYFRVELERCRTVERLCVLRDEAREALDAWRRQPLVAGQEPDSRAHPQWKFYIALHAVTPDDVGRLARRYSCSRALIYKVRNDYGLAA